MYHIRPRKLTPLIITIITLLVITLQISIAVEISVFLREDFYDLNMWEPLYFKKIEEHSVYTISGDDGSILKAESDASASGIVCKKEFNVYNYPKVRWRWKVSNVYEKGNALEKSGDDYPIRIYIMFKYDPENASFGEKIKYSLVKKLYGEYPPHSSLNYIWANRRHEEHFIPNPYASEAMMIPLQYGEANVGKWIEQEVDVLKDYRAAFGENPPQTARIAIMNDSDNTRESSDSYVDFIEVYR